MAHINTAKVQTADGIVEVTKTSTHRDYVAVSAVQFLDGTQVVLSWHLTTEAAVKYTQSNEAAGRAKHAAEKSGKEVQLVTFLPVTTKLTGKDKPAEAPAAPATHNEATALYAATTIDEAPVAQSGTTGNTCRCGCGEAIGTRSQYRPGHDARHASIVAQDIASSSAQYFERVTADSDLGSEALVQKAHRQAEALIAKAAAKAAKQAK